MKYIYRARDWNGKLVAGEVELATRAEVVDSIRSSGLVPLSVEEKKDSLFDEVSRRLFGKIGMKEVSNFTRQLATMMNAGLPVTDALTLLKNQTEDKAMMNEMLEYTLATVKGGKRLADGLQRYEKTFGEAYVASIAAGEEGGVLEDVLAKLADNLETETEFKGKVKGAMIYPVIVVIAMVGVALIMMIVVIPKLMVMYEDFGDAQLPMATQILMTMSDVLIKIWPLFPFLAFGLFSALKASAKVSKLREKKDKLLLKIPIMGELTRKTVIANTVRTLSMLLTAGISLVEALRIVSSVAGNEIYKNAYLKISERVQKGFSIANSFEETEVFPPIVNQMVETGEATGKLDEVLMRVADYFTTESEQAVKTLTAAIEPLIMVVLGIGVAFLVIAVIMPIYNLTSQF